MPAVSRASRAAVPTAPTRTADPGASLARIPELDAVRGLAACHVMGFHVLERPFLPGVWGVDAFLDWGWTGVDLFFVLSGFLIGSIVCQHRASPGFLSRFYARRALRILPLYYLFLALAYLCFEVVPRTPLPNAMPYAAYVFLVNDGFAIQLATLGKISVAWSLAVEEKYYLVAPWAAKHFSLRAQAILVGLALAAGLAWQVSINVLQPGGIENAAHVIRWEGLCLGTFIALALHVHGDQWLRQPATRAILGALLVAAFWLAFPARPSAHPWWNGLMTFRVALFYSVLFLGILSLAGTRATAWMRLPFFHWLMTISFGVYLFHNLVRFLVVQALNAAGVTGSGLLHGIASIPVTLALATLSWHLYEEPFVRRSHRAFAYRR